MAKSRNKRKKPDVVDLIQLAKTRGATFRNVRMASTNRTFTGKSVCFELKGDNKKTIRVFANGAIVTQGINKSKEFERIHTLVCKAIDKAPNKRLRATITIPTTEKSPRVIKPVNAMIVLSPPPFNDHRILMADLAVIVANASGCIANVVDGIGRISYIRIGISAGHVKVFSTGKIVVHVTESTLDNPEQLENGVANVVHAVDSFRKTMM